MDSFSLRANYYFIMIVGGGYGPVLKLFNLRSKYLGEVEAFPEAYNKLEGGKILKKRTEAIVRLDNTRIAAGDDFGRIVSYDISEFCESDPIENGPKPRILRGDGGKVHSLLYSQKYDLLFCGRDSNQFEWYKGDSGKKVASIKTKKKCMKTMCLHAGNGNRLITGSFNHDLSEWDIETRKRIQKRNSGNLNWALSSTTKTLAVGRGNVYIVDIRDFRKNLFNLIQTGINITVKYIPDKHLLIGSDSSDTRAPKQGFYVWDMRKNYNRIDTLGGHEKRIEKVDRVENHLITCSHDGTVKFWDIGSLPNFKEIESRRITDFVFRDRFGNVFQRGFQSFCVIPFMPKRTKYEVEDRLERLEFLKELILDEEEEEEGEEESMSILFPFLVDFSGMRIPRLFLIEKELVSLERLEMVRREEKLAMNSQNKNIEKDETPITEKLGKCTVM